MQPDGLEVSSTEGARAIIAAAATPNDMFFGSQYMLKDVASGGTGVQSLWGKMWGDITPTSTEVGAEDQVIIAVVDTGVKWDHEDLASVMWTGGDALNQAGVTSGTYGYDFVEKDTNPMDVDGHGTHVAGIIAATVNNATGVAGMAPNARIMALRAGDDNGSFSTSATISAYGYLVEAAKAGVHVTAVNNSWGGVGGDSLIVEAMDDLYETYGTISVMASGNYSYDNDALADYPSCLLTDGIISVDATDSAGNLASFSDYGAMTTDIGAPGVHILSTSGKATEYLVRLVDPDKTAAYDKFDDGATGVYDIAAAGSAGVNEEVGLSYEADIDSSATSKGVKWTVADAAAGGTSAVTLTTATDLTANKPVSLFFSGRQFDDTSDDSSRYMYVYMASTAPGEWVEISSSGFAMGGSWTQYALSISSEQSTQIDWETPKVRFERDLVEFDSGKDITYYIDNVGLAYDGALGTCPYVNYNGTSMATPVVTGALALLGAVYPADSVATLKNRLLGSVLKTDALKGRCTSDGRLDLSKSDDPYPVVSSLTQDVDNARTATISGSFFGDDEGNVSIEGIDDNQISVTSWNDSEIVLTLLAGLQSANLYVTVTRAGDSLVGRRLVSLEATDASNTATFDELPAPDYGALGLSRGSMVEPWKVVAAGGKIYATGSNARKTVGTGDDASEVLALICYDPATGAWTTTDIFNNVSTEYPIMCAYEDKIYLYDAGVDILYCYDTSTGNSAVVADFQEQEAFRGVGYEWCSMVSDGSTVTLVGAVRLVNEKYDYNLPILTIDLETGEATFGPLLVEGRKWSTSGYLDGTLYVAGGGTNDSAPAMSVEALQGDAFSSVSSLPERILISQLSTAAGATLPAGFRYIAADGSTVTLEHDCLVLSGLVDSSGSNSVDTYIYDPEANTWTATARILAPVKVSYVGGAYLDGTFYVLGYDATGNVGNGYGLVFRSLSSVEPDPEPTPTPTPDPGAGSSTSQASSTTATVTPYTADVSSMALVACAVAVLVAAALLYASKTMRGRGTTRRRGGNGESR